MASVAVPHIDKIGFVSKNLGLATALAFAFGTSEGAARTGFYADLTGGAEKIAVVVNAVEIGALTATAVVLNKPVQIGVAGGSRGSIQLNGSTSGSATIKVAAVAGTPADLTLPTTNGSAGDVLSTDGAGVLSWVAQSGSSPTLTATYVGYGDGSNLLTGENTFTYSAATNTLSLTGSLSVCREATRIADSVVIGPMTASWTVGQYSVAVGADSRSGNFSAALGGASIAGDLAVAAGFNAVANNIYSISIGCDSSATGESGVAVGYDATASGQWAVAIGHSALAQGSKSISIGYQASIGGNSCVLVGTGANSGSAGFLVGIGTDVISTGTGSVAIGKSAWATGDNSVSLGWSARADAKGAIAIGTVNITVSKTAGIGQSNDGNFVYASDRYITDFFIGGGSTSTTCEAITVRGSNASGTDITGGDFSIHGGRGTGSGVGGATRIKASAPGASGSTLNPAVDVLVATAGNVDITGNLRVSGLYRHSRQVLTASTTITASRVRFFGVTVAQTLTMPVGLDGMDVWVRNAGKVSVTLARNGADTIEGAATFVLYPGEAVCLTFIGTDWTVF